MEREEMMKKTEPTVTELYADEMLTDNSKISYCEQCKECRFWGNDEEDYFSNKYNKGNCDKYPIADGITKPDGILNNYEACMFREKR